MPGCGGATIPQYDGRYWWIHTEHDESMLLLVTVVLQAISLAFAE